MLMYVVGTVTNHNTRCKVIITLKSATHQPGNTNPKHQTNMAGNHDDKNCSSSSAAGSLLGIIAEFSSRPSNSEFGELQNSDITHRFEMLSTARSLLPNERIAECMYQPAPQASHVIGRYNPQTNSSRYVALKHCESSSCPHCAIQRSYEDRLELAAALAAAQEQNLHPVFITFTLSHHQTDDLEDLRAALGKAYDMVFSGRWFTEFKNTYGLAGRVKSWETPYGRNGWHPHLHGLFLLELELTDFWIGELEHNLSERWIAALQKLGFSASWKHGVKVETATSRIADYISKYGREPITPTWGVESEIALSPMKQSHESGLTPLQVLSAASGETSNLHALMLRLGVDTPQIAQKRAESLYVEYFRAFKGKSRLHWSKGLKTLLDVQERVNQIRLESPNPYDDEYDMVWIERGVNGWNKIRHEELRAELLAVIRSGDTWVISDWLRDHGISGSVTPGAWERAANIVTADGYGKPGHDVKKVTDSSTGGASHGSHRNDNVTKVNQITCDKTVTDTDSMPAAQCHTSPVTHETLEPGYQPGEQQSLFDQEHIFSEAYLKTYGENDDGHAPITKPIERGNNLQVDRGSIRTGKESRQKRRTTSSLHRF